jgi:diguanylate cyclase (GGDEF)-like protein/PAS domain S-box-containing protein
MRFAPTRLWERLRSEHHHRVVWGIGALLFSIWCFVGAWSYMERQSILAANSLVLEQLRAAVQAQTRGLFKQAESSLMVVNHWIASHPYEDPTKSPTFITLVDELRKASDGLLDVRMVTGSGQLRYIPDLGKTNNTNVSDREYVLAQQNPKTRGFHIGKPVLSRVTGKWGIPVSAPVERSGGDIRVIFIAMEIDRIAGTFDVERIKPEGTIGIVRTDGEILLRSPLNDDAMGKSATNGPGWPYIRKAPAAGQYDAPASLVDGLTRIVSYAQVDGYPLLVYVSDSKQALLRPWLFHTTVLSLLATLISIFGVAMGKELLRALTASRNAEAIVQSTDEAIVCKSLNGIVTSWNPGAERIFGYSAAEMLGKPILRLVPNERLQEASGILDKVRRGEGTDHLETLRICKDGRLINVSVTTSPMRDAMGRIIGASKIAQDITAFKLQQQKLEHGAHFDNLTDLPNRLLLSDRLHQAMTLCQRHNRSLAVLYLDLDGFKAINDQYGHKAGDDLLVAVSTRMREALRDVDTLARMGGDEFVAVLSDVESTQDCIQLVLRVLKACSEPVSVHGYVLRVTASIGVTIYPLDLAEADQLMRHADQAMYEAKQSGKNKFHMFDAAQDAEVKSRSVLQENIAKALARQEFVLFYQPKVNMRTGAIVGAEALIRWQHPSMGLLAPGTFLGAIERHPLNEALGAWVIDAALAQMSQWKAQGLTLSVSVNIAARQLQQEDFASDLADLLSNHFDVEPRRLELEVLETSALDNIEATAKILQACRRLGVHFAIDDFGTGYSSLTYLRHLPVETLKIDQSFVRDMLEDPDDLSIVRGVTGLAQAFHRAVIAEGVETIAHGTRLIELGCELAQGYVIARPMPAAHMPGWCASWKPPCEWTVSVACQ